MRMTVPTSIMRSATAVLGMSVASASAYLNAAEDADHGADYRTFHADGAIEYGNQPGQAAAEDAFSLRHRHHSRSQ